MWPNCNSPSTVGMTIRICFNSVEMYTFPQVGYRGMITLLSVRILTKPLPTLARPDKPTRDPSRGRRPTSEVQPGHKSPRSYLVSLITHCSPALLMTNKLASGFYAKLLPHTTVEWLYDNWVRQDDTSTRSLIVTRWISPNLARPLRYEPILAFHIRNTHPSHLNISFFYLPKISLFPFKYSHLCIFLVGNFSEYVQYTSCIMKWLGMKILAEMFENLSIYGYMKWSLWKHLYRPFYVVLRIFLCNQAFVMCRGILVV